MARRGKVCRVYFHHEKVHVDVEEGVDLRTAALACGVNLYKPPFNILNCRGHGLCGTCLVALTSAANVTPPTFVEKWHSLLHGLDPLHILFGLNLSTDYPAPYHPDHGHAVGVGYVTWGELKAVIRLACQTKVRGDVRVLTLWPHGRPIYHTEKIKLLGS